MMKRRLVYEAFEVHRQSPSSLESLELVLDGYKPPCDTSEKLLTSDTMQIKNKSVKLTSEKEKEFVKRLSKDLSLDQVQSFELLRAFIRVELSTPSALEKYGWKTLQYDDQLYLAIQHYYFMEREATCLLLSALLRASDDSDHFYYKEAHDYISRILTPDFENRLFQLLERFLGSNKTGAWAAQNLLEQKLLLELMILLYYQRSCGAKMVEKLLSLLSKYQFGTHQVNRQFFDATHLVTFDYVCHLCIVLVTEILSLEMVQLLPPQTLLSIHDLLWTAMFTSKDTIIGPVLMAWSCYCEASINQLSYSCPKEYEELYFFLTQTHRDAKSPQVMLQFAYTQCQTISYFIQSIKKLYPDNPNELAYRSILKGLLMSFFSTVTVANLPDKLLLVEFMCVLFENEPDLCQQFWEQDYALDARRSLLESCRRSFPIDFTLLKLLSKLIGNVKTVQYVFSFLADNFCFADYLKTEDYTVHLDYTEFRGSNLVYGANNIPFGPPPGTVGHIVGKNVVILEFRYSTWHCFQSFLDSFVNSPMLDERRLHGTLESTLEILNLINAVLKYSDGSTLESFIQHIGEMRLGDSNAEQFISLISAVLAKCCSFTTPPCDLIRAALECLRLLLPVYPQIIWKQLRAQQIIPHISSPSYIQSTVIPFEASVGVYPVTESYLKLIKELTLNILKRGDSVKNDLIYHNLVFIHNIVFPSIGSWRYVSLYQKFDNMLTVLQLFNILLDSDMEKSVEFLKQSHVVMVPLIDIVGLGHQSLLELHRIHKRKEAHTLEETILSALKLIGLMIYLNPIHADALLNATTEIILTIADYIHYDYNPQLSITATQLLTLICSVVAEQGKQMSLVGYFGTKAFSLVSKFISILQSHANDLLKEAVYEFVSQVIISQPALGAMFLFGSSDYKDKNPEQSVLVPIKSLLKDCDQQDEYLIAAGLKLVYHLWKRAIDHKEALDNLKTPSDFDLFKILEKLLKPKDSPIGYQIHAYCLGIVTLESFYSKKPIMEKWIEQQPLFFNALIDFEPPTLSIHKTVSFNKRYGSDYIYKGVDQQMRSINLKLSEADCKLNLLKTWSLWVQVVEPKKPEMLIGIAKGLKDHQLLGPVNSLFRNEVATLLSFMVHKYSQYDTGKLLSIVVDCFQIDRFPLGPAGYFSLFPFHTHLLCCLLKLLNDKESTVYPTLVPIIIHGISFILMDPHHEAFVQQLSFASPVLLLLLKKNVSMWPVVERYSLLQSLVSCFSTIIAINIEHPALELLMDLLLAFSSHSVSAERLAVYGLIGTFCNNAMSPTLVEGKLIHGKRIWCLMMGIVGNLVRMIDHPKILLEATGFTKLYTNQIQKSFDFDTIQPHVVQELLMAAPLFGNVPCQHLLSLLSKLVHLFKSPLEFSRKLSMDKEEAQTKLIQVTIQILNILIITDTPVPLTMSTSVCSIGTIFDLIRFFISIKHSMGIQMGMSLAATQLMHVDLENEIGTEWFSTVKDIEALKMKEASQLMTALNTVITL